MQSLNYGWNGTDRHGNEHHIRPLHPLEDVLGDLIAYPQGKCILKVSAGSANADDAPHGPGLTQGTGQRAPDQPHTDYRQPIYFCDHSIWHPTSTADTSREFSETGSTA